MRNAADRNCCAAADSRQSLPLAPKGQAGGSCQSAGSLLLSTNWSLASRHQSESQKYVSSEMCSKVQSAVPAVLYCFNYHKYYIEMCKTAAIQNNSILLAIHSAVYMH